MSSRKVSKFSQLRQWDGSQARAFEELTYQLRDREPDGVEVIKTGNPDGGVEWYWRYEDGSEWGWQAKFYDDIDDLLSAMRASLVRVVDQRQRMRRLTFCIPFDLSDVPDPPRGVMARQKFEDAVTRWKTDITGDVDIKLWTAGDLLERLARPENRGRTWFWFDEAVLDDDFLAKRLKASQEEAGDRYTPPLHIELPIAHAIHAAALGEAFKNDVASAWGAVSSAAKELGPPESVRTLLLDVERAATSWPIEPGLPDVETAVAAADAGLGAYAEELQGDTDVDRYRLRKVWAVRDELLALSGLLHHSAEGSAAASGTVLISGEAGAGKTHLCCETAGTLIERGHGALVVLGQHLDAAHPIDSLIAHLGLAGIGADELVGAMAAYGEASGKRFVLLIDALNEADHPQAWGKQLGEVRRLLQGSPWTALVVTCRSIYLHWLDSPGGGGHGMPEVVHPGFSGHEREAQDKFFDFYGVDAPAAPLVLPEFTNPLFLKLYCLGGADEPTAGASAIFEGFIAKRTERIDIDLDIDPHDDLVRQAVSGLAGAMAERGSERLPYEEGKRLIDAFLPGRTKFEETLFGRLLREGILAVSHAVLDGEWRRTVGFPYQRFSDHVIVSSLLDEHAAELHGREPLGPWVENLTPGLYAAMAVAVPERSGTELADRLPSPLAADDRIARTQIASLARRRPDAVSKRTVEWLVERWELESDRQRIADVLTAVAPVEAHALNGDWLHAWLGKQTLVDRDRAWTWATYELANVASSSLTSLITWAARGPSERVDDATLLLAVVPLMYALASPNRFLRDGVTKALVSALTGRPEAVAGFLMKAYEVDDGYVRERSCAVAYGCALRRSDEQGASPQWKTVCQMALPFAADVNALTRDHVANLCRWAVNMGIDGAADFVGGACPPYDSDPPAEPPSQEDLKAALKDEGWMILSSSVFSKWSDFTRYEVEPVCDRIAFTVRQEEVATASLLRAWAWGLTQDERETLRTQPREQQLEVFLQWLDANEDRKTHTVIDNPPVEFAMRWVTQRCLDYGWTPELFDEIDRGIARYRGAHGREAAKPERFGKKYQWLSLFELAARWTDKYKLDAWEGEESYTGAWQLWLRDIDPSLPLGEPLEAFDEAPPGPSISEEGAWAWPPGPTFSPDERDRAEWAQRQDDLPDPVRCVRREHPDGTTWVVLGGYFNHADDPRTDTSLDRTDRCLREFGMLFTSRLIRSDDGEQVDGWLASKPDVLRRDPEWQTQAAGQVYLGEMPWAEAAAGRANEWHDADPEQHWPVTSVRALSDYIWEGGVTHDCSLSSSVSCYCPGSVLWETEALTWDGHAAVWTSGTSRVLMAAEGRRGRLVLARSDWLAELLTRKGWILLAGLFAERRVFVPGRPFENLETEGWVDYGAAVRVSSEGHIGHGWWTLRDRVTEAREGEWPPGRDGEAEASDSGTGEEATS